MAKTIVCCMCEARTPFWVVWANSAGVMAHFCENDCLLQRLSWLGWTQDEIAEALKRQWPEGAVTRQRAAQILQENAKVLVACKTDFTGGGGAGEEPLRGAPGCSTVYRSSF